MHNLQIKPSPNKNLTSSIDVKVQFAQLKTFEKVCIKQREELLRERGKMFYFVL